MLPINIYPYRNITDLNLDFMQKVIRELEHEVRDFVSINAIKYADPIQWDITRSYEKNTVVIDGNSGVAYISVAPVPYGVALTRPEYWTVIFDLSMFITKGAANFANTYEVNPTVTATMDTGEGDWLVWNSTLYQALTDIHAGDTYTPDGNIKQMTVEDFYNILVGLLQAEAQTRYDEDTRIELELTDLINSQIGIEAQTRADEDTRIELELTDLVNSQIGIVQGEIGDLNDLNTTDKDSVVDAINEVIGMIGNIDELNVINVVSDIGCASDGSTDCAQAINDYLAADTSGAPLLFPYGTFKADSTIEIVNRDVYILGQVFTNNDITLFKLTGKRMKFVFNKIGYSSTTDITSLDAGTSKACAIEIIPEGDVCNAINIYGAYILANVGIKFSGYGTGFTQNVNISDIYMLCRTACVTSDLSTGYWINEVIFKGCAFGCYQASDTSELVRLHETTHGNLMNGWRFIGCAFEGFNTAFDLEGAKVYLTNCRMSRQEAFDAATAKYFICDHSEFDFDGKIEYANVANSFVLDASSNGTLRGYINNNGVIGNYAFIIYDGANEFGFIEQNVLGRAFTHTFSANNESVNCGYGFDLSKGIQINVGAYTGCTVTVVYNNNYRPSATANDGYYSGYKPCVITLSGTATVTLATPNGLGGGTSHVLDPTKTYIMTRDKTIAI